MSDDLTNAVPEPVADQTTIEPAAAPVAEPVADDFTPDLSWMDNVGVVDEPAQPQQPQYNYQPPQAQPQPPPAPYPAPAPAPNQPRPDYYNDSEVNRYIDDRAQRIAQEMVQQNIGPVAVQLQHFQRQNMINRRLTADSELNRAKFNSQKTIREDVARDKAYREDKRVREEVDRNLQNWMNWGYQEAMETGNIGKLQALEDPGFFRILLAATKERVGYQAPVAGPATPAGAVLETQTPPVNEPVVELPPDMQEVANMMGPAFEEKLKRELAVTNKAGDYEDYES
jgi:hypothetical protein